MAVKVMLHTFQHKKPYKTKEFAALIALWLDSCFRRNDKKKLFTTPLVLMKLFFGIPWL